MSDEPAARDVAIAGVRDGDLTCEDCFRAVAALFLHVGRDVFVCIDCHPCADHHPLIPRR